MFIQGKTIVILLSFLDPSTKEALPYITDVFNGKISLSDGSTWQEDALLYYSSNFWNIGDYICVTALSDSALLINMNSTRNILNAYHAKTKMLDYEQS